MDNHFGGIIWTNHALDRMRERGIKQGDAWATWNRPEQSRKGSSGNWVYYRTYPSVSGPAQRIEVVATQNEKKEWIILSVWSKPVFQKVQNTPSGKSFWKLLLDKLFS